MSEVDVKLEKFIESLVNKRDLPLLDILWLFSYTIPSSKHKFHNNITIFRSWFNIVCKRNLEVKYGNSLVTKTKMMTFIKFLESMPDFLSKDSFYNDKRLLRKILNNKGLEPIIQEINYNLKKASDIDRKILAFILEYISTKIKTSEKVSSFDFYVRIEEDVSDIIYEIIDIEYWTHVFNKLYNETLGGDTYKVELNQKTGPKTLLPGQYKEFTFWHLGDKLVKMGLGYWSFSITKKGYTDIIFIIPKVRYDVILKQKDTLPIIPNFEKIIDEIEEEVETELRWNLSVFDRE